MPCTDEGFCVVHWQLHVTAFCSRLKCPMLMNSCWSWWFSHYSIANIIDCMLGLINSSSWLVPPFSILLHEQTLLLRSMRSVLKLMKKDDMCWFSFRTKNKDILVKNSWTCILKVKAVVQCNDYLGLGNTSLHFLSCNSLSIKLNDIFLSAFMSVQFESISIFPDFCLSATVG